jgi:hypothetical protein
MLGPTALFGRVDRPSESLPEGRTSTDGLFTKAVAEEAAAMVETNARTSDECIPGRPFGVCLYAAAAP